MKKEDFSWINICRNIRELRVALYAVKRARKAMEKLDLNNTPSRSALELQLINAQLWQLECALGQLEGQLAKHKATAEQILRQ